MIEITVGSEVEQADTKQQENPTLKAGGQRPTVAEAAGPKAPVLITESAEEFNVLLQQTEQEIGPCGRIAKMMVNNTCSIIWEIRRLNQCKTQLVTSEWRPALETVLIRVLEMPGRPDSSVRDEAEALTLGWFTDGEIKKKVSVLLARFGLDEFDIEAEAIRRSLPDLEPLNRMLTSLETRLNRGHLEK